MRDLYLIHSNDDPGYNVYSLRIKYDIELILVSLYSLSLFCFLQTHTSHDTPTDVFLYYLEEYPGITFDTELI